ncbi:MAG: hypothetical protein LBH06_05165 [Rikenellaceae bacterium]|nr:hypothetical protein [Rikenellaceae bacterium]
MLRKYDEVETFYDDPIIKSYAESYYSCFNITDEYANKPLSPKHILLLDEYLEFVEKKIDNYATDNNRAQIEDIKENVRSLKNKLTSEFGQVICNSLAYI